MIKRFFSTDIHPELSSIWLLLFRVCAAAFLLTHGYPKFMKLVSGEEIKFADPIGIGTVPSFYLVVFAEFFCSLLVIVGLATRFATMVLIINMGVAEFLALGGTPFAQRETAAMYLIIFITLLITGPGKYSVDNLISKRFP